MRPACPPPPIRAYHTWTWIAAEWEMYLNGVWCYGDGYYYDGYYYYYNEACYTQPPTTIAIWQ